MIHWIHPAMNQTGKETLLMDIHAPYTILHVPRAFILLHKVYRLDSLAAINDTPDDKNGIRYRFALQLQYIAQMLVVVYFYLSPESY